MTLPVDLIRPRRITGMAAVLLPFTADGDVDWGAFEGLVERTARAGLVPAVNMDTGYAHLLDAGTKGEAVRRTTALVGAEFVAGTFDTAEALAVRDAGGIGMILVNTTPASLNADLHYVPSVHLSDTVRAALKAYDATTGATARIGKATIVRNVPAPFTASFSFSAMVSPPTSSPRSG